MNMRTAETVILSKNPHNRTDNKDDDIFHDIVSFLFNRAGYFYRNDNALEAERMLDIASNTTFHLLTPRQQKRVMA